MTLTASGGNSQISQTGQFTQDDKEATSAFNPYNLELLISCFSIVACPGLLVRKVALKWPTGFLFFVHFLWPFSVYKTNPPCSAPWNTYSILWNGMLPSSTITKPMKIFKRNCYNCAFWFQYSSDKESKFRLKKMSDTSRKLLIPRKQAKRPWKTYSTTWKTHP